MRRPKEVEFRIQCGCLVTHTRVLKACEACEAAWKEVHERWAAERAALPGAAVPLEKEVAA